MASPQSPQTVFIQWRGTQSHHGTSPKMVDTKITVENEARDKLLDLLKRRRGTVQVEYGTRSFDAPDREHGLIYTWTGPDRESVKFRDEHSDTDGVKDKWTGTVTVDLASEFNVASI
ncbi:hypothetical protein BFJ63_vAg17586 [Fusarium oxysporum f. sp. narcissi]|uniref:Uncharacterized protein n=1 Tax=Fusarium oxysporum f. sp. narcissi TaxID=451672 RepID=A0A4Q2V3W0_FUSOX|nr:hypothetical protein BFJ63_vAg17586 [Fusarium oxysporum f. sp. narcissi]